MNLRIWGLYAILTVLFFKRRSQSVLEADVTLQTTLFSFSGSSVLPPASPVNIALVVEINVSDVLTFQPSHYVDTFLRFLKEGDVGYYAYLNGKCCHRSWVQKGPKWVAINPFVQMKLEKNEGFVHYCETAPWARGKGVYPAVLRRIAEDHKDLDNLFICVDSENTPSIRGVEKAGFKERERVKVNMIMKIPVYNVFASSSLPRGSRRSYRAFWPLVRRSLGLCKRLLARAVRRGKNGDA